MKGQDAKRLKELERENATLKRIVADKELEVVARRGVRLPGRSTRGDRRLAGGLQLAPPALIARDARAPAVFAARWAAGSEQSAVAA
jgi:hypothetical protein